MYSVSLFLLALTVQTDGFTPGDVQCSECHENVNNNNNFNIVNYCTAEDVSNNISFNVRRDKNGEVSDSLKIEFASLKREVCKYEIALLVNTLIKDERECGEHKFEEAGNINSNVHTERTIYTNNTNQLGNIELWFQYIFTGCYAVRFYIGRSKYIIRSQKYLNTTYIRTEVKEPEFMCKYDIPSNFTSFHLEQRHEVTNFILNISLPVDTGLSLYIYLISNKDVGKLCTYQREHLIFNRSINLRVNTFKKVLRDDDCTTKLVSTNGKYIKTVQCNFTVIQNTSTGQTQTMQNTSYCIAFSIYDVRCVKDTIWIAANNKYPCTWIKSCAKTVKSSQYIESTNVISESQKLLGTSSYLLLPIIAIVLIVSAIVGTLCFWHYLRIRKEEVTLYVNPQHDDFLNPACLKSTNFDIVDNNDSEKGIDHDNFTCDIILLYTKSSPSFMALMKDFRETLTKMCSCSVHDWHDGAEWNDVAKFGPVLWFSQLLNSGCRVIWIDTPATRSIVISNSKGSDSNLNKLSKYYDIGDFRDMTFPVVLELAKRNTKDVMQQYRRHFVVRFEGLENTANVNDPFLDVSPHARYRMPQHLAQLCSDLSVVKPIIPKYMMKAEEDLLQQRLKFIKMESVM